MAFHEDQGRGREVAIGFGSKQGVMPRLPSQAVHQEAFRTKACSGLAEQQRHHHNRHNFHDQRLSPQFYCSRSSHYISRPKDVKNWVSGGHGMQEVFLDYSSHKSRGSTGVFLPQRAGGTNFYSRKKPACATVLLPDHVIQELNLNVGELGLHISLKDRHRKRCRSGHEDDDDTQNYISSSPRNKIISGSKGDEQCYNILSGNQTNPNSAPELCLPKEWTY